MAAKIEYVKSAFVISLDFELHWGVRDQFPLKGAYTPNLEGARTVIPKTLELFKTYDIGATWATVGFLFARSKDELLSYFPAIKPVYTEKRLDPYVEPLGQGEADDPLHYAPSLIQRILDTPKQEMATHTFSHYYCLEAGQTAESFRADLQSAKAIAKSWNVDIRSIVFPRNQINPAYNQILLDENIPIYRGNETNWFYQAAATGEQGYAKRGGRLLDTYVPMTAHHLGNWQNIKQSNGLYNVPSTRFLRPHSHKLSLFESLRLHRITQGIRQAAKQGKIYGLWWHPHNMGLHQEQNLNFLKRILETVRDCRERYGMEAVSMSEVVRKLEGF